ncbi:class I SAM-dependent methyltransferase [Streptomyces sp. HNM0663]|uniref:Class I SAM-dependent methyltransferase n=1 Tax=Streptomyces chengmaiensis TaxID=3040919 RepID=A0ABT6HSR8_9ACTN|nr:class I SAM-dependent methyltransferase [Streptomyces chengmaiensis]
MTPTLVQHRQDRQDHQHRRHGRYDTTAHSAAHTSAAAASARDWAEIQERMLAPLYEAVYERLEVGPGTRVLGLGCGSGLALLLAAARGAEVTGVDTDLERLALARQRLDSADDAGGGDGGRARAVLVEGAASDAASAGPFDVIVAFHPIGCTADDCEALVAELEAAVRLAPRGAAVVLTGWGPPERCATSGVLRVADRLTERLRTEDGRPGDAWRPALRDDLEDVAAKAGLAPDGSGRVACPFGYADADSAVRGLLSTGLYSEAVRATDQAQVRKEIDEALEPYRRGDGTVWMPNVFRYLITRTA